MAPVKPGLPGWSLSLNYWRLDLLLHLHPPHLPPEWQGQSQDLLDIGLLGKDTCSVGHALHLGCSLDNSLIRDSRTLICGRELKCLTWICDREV